MSSDNNNLIKQSILLYSVLQNFAHVHINLNHLVTHIKHTLHKNHLVTHIKHTLHKKNIMNFAFDYHCHSACLLVTVMSALISF